MQTNTSTTKPMIVKIKSSAPTTLGVIDQIALATKRRNLLATAAGAVLGGFVPFASYTIAHHEVSTNPAMWTLVVGGLAYSALTVFDWAKIAFKNPVKAVGFVVLLEGVMTFAESPVISYGALGILVCINALATGASLVLDKKANRETRRTK